MLFLRFIGATAVALLFDYLVALFHRVYFMGIAHTFAKWSWGSLFLYVILGSIIFFIGKKQLVNIGGMILFGLVKDSKIMAAVPIVIFVIGTIVAFCNIFLSPKGTIVNDIGQGVWYYLGSVIMFLSMLKCYVDCCLVCSIGLFNRQ